MIMNLKKAGEAGTPIKRFHFGPNGEFQCIAGKRDGGIPFFVVPTRYSLQFETWVNGLLRNKRAKLAQVKVDFPSGKNNFYEIQTLNIGHQAD